jgi:hypothetical protein
MRRRCRSSGRCWAGTSPSIGGWWISRPASRRAPAVAVDLLDAPRSGHRPDGGWFHKTTEQWAMETGLSPKEQASAREVLRGLALLDDQRMGIPARLHFRLRRGRAGRAARRSDRWPSAGGRLERPARARGTARSVGGLPPDARRVAGGVHAGLMLSRALHLTRLQVQDRLDQWIASSAARWFEELGLTRREQETARRDLVRAGLWEECLRGIPPSLVARIGSTACCTADRRRIGGTGHRPARRDPERDVGAANDSPKSESRLWQPRSLATPNPPRQFGPTREHGSPESAALLMNHSTGESLQPQNTGSPAPAPAAVDGGEVDLSRADAVLAPTEN